ncbi:hypothetical protein Ancab_028533 [Ancistrocladus abbreviatus]
MGRVEQQKFQLEEAEASGKFDQQSSSDSLSVDSTKEDATNSAASSSDLMEDATSPTSYSSSSSSSSSSLNGPLYVLSELMAHLPIKRGLSKYYDGKSQSFASLASVQSLEDLAKKENPYRRKRMKFSTSCGGGLDGHKFYTAPKPKATITKKISSSRGGSFLSTLARSDLIHGCRPPPIPVQKHL